VATFPSDDIVLPLRRILGGRVAQAVQRSLGLHDVSSGFALAYWTLATLAFGGALFGRRHPAASAFLHGDVSSVCGEYTHWRWTDCANEDIACYHARARAWMKA
jgi:hypothetical protein